MIKTLWQQQVFRYLVIGVFNTLIGYLLYCLFIFIGLHYTWAVLGANVISVVINFNTQGRVVFEHIHRSQFIKFSAMVIVNYFVNILLIHLFYYVVPNYYIAGLAATLIIAASSFFMSKHWVFVKK